MRCWSVYRSIFINGIIFSWHLSKNETSYYDSCRNSELFKMKPLLGKPCIKWLFHVWIFIFLRISGLEVWNRNFPIDGACHQFRDRTTASSAPSSPSSSWERFPLDNNPRSIDQCIYYKHQHVEFCAYELRLVDSTGFLLPLEENCCRIASNACRSLR